jgi:two-component system KDP operon response regulator KdpE
MKALIIEDDLDTIESVTQILRMRWPEIRLSSTHLGKRGVKLAGSISPHVIILDLVLPDICGLEVLKQIRTFSSVPIIILSARSDETDVVKGLQWGADDYIVKPCSNLELLARVKARVHTEDSASDEEIFVYGPLYYNAATRRLQYEEKEINLTAIESRIIHYLIRNIGHISTYSKISQAVWGDDSHNAINSLRVHIRRLRKKIETEPGRPELIATKAGVGYFLRESTPAKKE